MGESMEVKRCTREEYGEFLNAANNAFSYGAANEWFQKNLTNCTPYPSIATDQEINNHFICYCDGQLAGGLGAYPLDWTVSSPEGKTAQVKAYGIGQVCCLPAYRGRGVMTAVLKASESAMRGQGFTLGYLSGDRFRYGRFGYDFGGNAVQYTLNGKRFLQHPPNASGLTIRQAAPSDYEELNNAYNTLPSRAVRSARMWELQLQRQNFHWYIGDIDGHKGYAAYEKPDEIIELYGEPGTVSAMLRALFEKNAIERIRVSYPIQNGVYDAINHMLHETASYMQVNMLGLTAIVDIQGLLTELAPLWESDILSMDSFGKTAGADKGKYILARRLLGYAQTPVLNTLPDTLKRKLTSVIPLCAWMSSADDI